MIYKQIHYLYPKGIFMVFGENHQRRLQYNENHVKIHSESEFIHQKWEFVATPYPDVYIPG